VEDGSFEEDSARWVFGGDGERSRTVHGTWAPHAGTWMANLEMDWRTSQAYAYATHDLDLLALAPGCYDLSFWYRVVAEAPVVSPSGTYPWFVVRADPGPWTDLPSGGEIWFVLRPSDWYSAATTTDGSTYSTPWTWQTTTWEVTAQVPQPWLTFQVGTSIDDYDVHVLVDEVSLTVGTCGT
jgi:hypothetical protein